MIWSRILTVFWHGLSAALISGSGTLIGIVTVKKAMPEGWEWILVGAFAVGAFARGTSSYVQEPK